MRRQQGRRGRDPWWVSWPALLIVMLVAVVVGGWSVQVLADRAQESALEQEVETAQVVQGLTVLRAVDGGVFSGSGLSVADGADLQGDVEQLRTAGRLVGLKVWRMDGTPVFVDDGQPFPQGHLPATELARARSGDIWAVPDGAGQTEAASSGQAAVAVFVAAVLPGTGQQVGVTEVLLPKARLTAAVAGATRTLELTFAASVVLVAVGLLLLRRQLRRRERQARHDGLTGLLNRAALEADGGDLLQRGPGMAAVLLMDLDGFKAINDTLGHAAGDTLLCEVADALRATVRPGDLIARLGGDEFVVVLAGLHDGDQARARADRLLAQLRAECFTVSGVQLAVDASIGVALAPDHGGDVATLLQRADVAMYQAKRAHRGVTVYDPAADHHTVGQLEILVELRDAIDTGQLVLHYQPKVSLIDGSITGVEALVRWQHPDRGLVPPSAFLPLAENTGLIHPLTGWVLLEATRQAARWAAAGRPLPVAINISPHSLLDGDLPAMVLDALSAVELPASLLEIEITETAVMTDPDQAVTILRQLDAMGVKLSIDDFGSGYTSLSYLRSLPVACLKVDRGLVTNMNTHPEDAAITQAVIGLAHQLGLVVLAEGVESDAVLDRLRGMSCDEIQGYLLTQPLPVSELDSWLAHRAGHVEPTANSRPIPATRPPLDRPRGQVEHSRLLGG
jgi:diguanylate cyclase (GGDEF)-like protein